MRRKSQRSKTEQINVRLTLAEKRALETIAARELRTKSFLIAQFTRWAIRHYNKIGSLAELWTAEVTTQKQADYLREVGEKAEDRLQRRIAR